MKKTPLLTIGIISYNRYRYLRVLIDSLKQCIQYPSVEWLLADGGSIEPGLQDYLSRLDGFTVRSTKESHADSLNWLIQHAKGEVMMIVPEDIQFIRRGPWIKDAVELVLQNLNVGSVVFDAQRESTVRAQLMERDVRILGKRIPAIKRRRKPDVFVGSHGEKFFSAGNSRDGISMAGIMSISRTALWHEIGPFRTRQTSAGGATNDSSLGAEDDMIARVRNHPKWGKLEAYLMQYPAAADIITDMRGTKARVRAGFQRYGAYRSPPDGMFYYQIFDAEEKNDSPPDSLPVWPLERWVEPIGFALPLDSSGAIRKVSVVKEGEPWTHVGDEDVPEPWPKTNTL